LIEAYHGRITIESALGHGSVFRITLPILSDADAAVLNDKKAQAQAANDIPGIKSELLETPAAEQDGEEQSRPKQD